MRDGGGGGSFSLTCRDGKVAEKPGANGAPRDRGDDERKPESEGGHARACVRIVVPRPASSTCTVARAPGVRTGRSERPPRRGERVRPRCARFARSPSRRANPNLSCGHVTAPEIDATSRPRESRRSRALRGGRSECQSRGSSLPASLSVPRSPVSRLTTRLRSASTDPVQSRGRLPSRGKLGVRPRHPSARYGISIRTYHSRSARRFKRARSHPPPSGSIRPHGRDSRSAARLSAPRRMRVHAVP